MAQANVAANPLDDSAQTEYNGIRLKLIMAQLPMIYDSTSHIAQVRAIYEAAMNELVDTSEAELFGLPDEALATMISRATSYYGLHHGHESSSIRRLLARMYRNAMPSLSFDVPHVGRLRHKSCGAPSKRITEAGCDHSRRRIRVAFHTSSDGTSMNGLIRLLSRDQFLVFLIFDGSSSMNESPPEESTSVEHVVMLSQELKRAQQQVAQLELDVLVFTDIGLHMNAYLLASARLALRTAVLRDNHAIPSGIDTIDYIIALIRWIL